MAYATADDVAVLIPEITLGAATEPSTSEVGDMIAQYEGEINGILTARGYDTVPATGTSDVALLQGYVARKVAADVWLIHFQRDDPPYKVKQWSDSYADFIARLRRREQDLVDQSARSRIGVVYSKRHVED